ncbi:MAG: anaerobic ribonucleoside-triphosphate reductase activating protein [Prevotella sp.]|nr:anaerobic ribonucleoside-triphosphate reductase activating protein [Prevotella sp.]
MLKYVNTGVVFQEIPDETTLSVNISRCPCHCPGCHSKYLAEDIGEPLDELAVDSLIRSYGKDVTCIAFMGGDAEPWTVNDLAHYVRKCHPGFRIAWYSGRLRMSPQIDRCNFDYIKIGPYIAHLGPLNSATTNQRLYKCLPDGGLEDITHRFWKK